MVQKNSDYRNSGFVNTIVIKALWHFPFFSFLTPCQMLTIFTATQIETSRAVMNCHNYYIVLSVPALASTFFQIVQ